MASQYGAMFYFHCDQQLWWAWTNCTRCRGVINSCHPGVVFVFVRVSAFRSSLVNSRWLWHYEGSSGALLSLSWCVTKAAVRLGDSSVWCYKPAPINTSHLQWSTLTCQPTAQRAPGIHLVFSSFCLLFSVLAHFTWETAVALKLNLALVIVPFVIVH